MPKLGKEMFQNSIGVAIKFPRLSTLILIVFPALLTENSSYNMQFATPPSNQVRIFDTGQ